MPYRDLMVSPALSPRWLLRGSGKIWLSAAGQQKDDDVERLKSSVKLRFPRTAPVDGLEAIGDERMIERGIGETTAAYRTRLRNAWTLWTYAGTAYGVLVALRDVGYPGAYVRIARGKVYALGTDGGLTTYLQPDISVGRSGFWSLFDVIFSSAPTGWTVRPSTDDPRVELMRRTIKRWKSSFATCVRMIIIHSGWVLGFPPPPSTPVLGAPGLTLDSDVWIYAV